MSESRSYPIGFQCHDWTVISEKEVVRKRKRLIRCRCKCGHESLILAYRLRPHSQDGATSCPACAMAKRKAIYTHTLTREYLVQQYIDAHRTINDIARETGFDQLTVRRRLCAHGIPLRKRSDAESHQLTGRVFGLLTVGAMLRKRQRSGAVIYYRCVCTCGAVREVRAAHLIAGASKACKRCASGHSASSPHWTGCGEITGYYWGRVCRGAKQRGLVVEITIEQAWQVFLRQKRRCALTDLPLVMLGGNAAESEPTASLDRIDSKLGYVAGNVQWVHKDINRMKNDFEETYFRELCRLITEQLAYRKSPKA